MGEYECIAGRYHQYGAISRESEIKGGDAESGKSSDLQQSVRVRFITAAVGNISPEQIIPLFSFAHRSFITFFLSSFFILDSVR